MQPVDFPACSLRDKPYRKPEGVVEQTYYRWRRQYGGMGVDQLRELKRLQKENKRLRRAVTPEDVERAYRERRFLMRTSVRNKARLFLLVTSAAKSSDKSDDKGKKQRERPTQSLIK